MRHLLTLLFVAVSITAAEPANSKWYKGNTHTHTILCGHADSTPDVVAQWYLDRGYNFLCLSEHNQFLDPKTVNLPEGRRSDFILIPGQEITGSVHTTALNVPRMIPFKFTSKKQFEVIQNHIDGTREAGGTPILNHPNFRWAVKADDILAVKHLHLFELYNGHPTVNNWGDAAHPSVEMIWDKLLSDGLVVYGVSSDDMHDLKKWGQKVSNPGRGWVMVRSESLTPDAITQAMKKGDFYASSGVILKSVAVTSSNYAVEVDEVASKKELESPVLITHRVETGGADGWNIEFVGKDGKTLKTVAGTKAEFPLTPENPYVRCKITFGRKTDAGSDQIYAWTQPAFTDGREQKLEK